MQTMLTLKNEVPADAKYCCPDQVLFSPDEKWFAVAWSHRDEKGTSLSSEIRFYDTASWSEQSRLRILEAGHCGLVCWQKNQLWCSRGVPGKASLNEHFLDIYRFDATASFPDNVLANTELVDHGYSRNYANPLYVREYRIATQQGVDWYMVKDFRECSQPAWIESLRNMPLLSGTINRFLPRDSLALEFYQTSTKQKLNRLSIQPNSHCCISSDGHWMVVLLNGKNHYGLYSTTALIRWPGYLLVLVVFFILFGRVLGGLNSSQKPV